MDIAEELRQDREKGARRLESEYKAGMMTLARRFCADEGDAEELVNRTFAAVVDGIDGYLEQSAFFAWMCQIMSNLHSMECRRKSHQMEVFPDVMPDVADEAAREAIYNSLDATIVREALKSLPPDQRESLILYYFFDMPVAKIAKFLAIPAGTVRSRLHYARKALAAKLGAAAKKPGGKALLLALALCGLTALGAAVYTIAASGEAQDMGGAASGHAAAAWTGATSGTGTTGATGEGTGATGGADARPASSAGPSVPFVPSVPDLQLQPTELPQQKTTMNATALRTFAASAALTVAGANANTVAWWHFDEADPGTVAAADTIASGMSSDVFAQPYSLSDATATKASGAYLPVFAKPFRGLCVYDPVSGEKRVNRAAMKFTTAEGAKFGGALHILTTASDQYQSAAGSITVEAFVCTTGGVFSTFAPIVSCMQYENWTSEKWAIYMETDGTIALRFGGTAYYSGNSGQSGTAKVNDGVWHHVALTWDGATVKVFVDYEQDKFKSNGNPRQFAKSGAINYNNGGQWDYTRIGGYTGKSGEATARRRFNGLIDEVRVSNVALTPDQFLRLQPLDMDEDEVLRVSFDPDEFGALNAEVNLADALGYNYPKALLKCRNNGGAAAFDTAEKPSAAIGPALFANGVENVASIHFTTNGTGADSGCFMSAPNLAKWLVGGSTTNYTIECFYKTSGQIRGATSKRQAVFRLGAWRNLGSATLCADDGNGSGMETGKMMVSVRDNPNNTDRYDSTFDSNLDDGAWHHVAFVIDGENHQARTYIDGRISHRRQNFDMVFAYENNNYPLYAGCGFDGGSAWKPIQFFDGWIDALRVTKRALAPEEFMSKNSFGKIGDGPQPLLLADFNDGSFNLVCASNATFTVSGVGEARNGGSSPAFVDSVFGSLLLDGPNGTDKETSVKDLAMNRSRVVFPFSPLYELDSYTVEFWAKFTGIVDENGSAANDSTSLAGRVPVLVCSQGGGADYDWYLCRPYWESDALALSVRRNIAGDKVDYDIEFPLNHNVVDGKWHHYALTFATSADTMKTSVSLYDDGDLADTRELASAVFVTRAGRVIKLLEGSSDQPNLVGIVNSLRISRGVLPPSRFLGRDRSDTPFVMVVR